MHVKRVLIILLLSFTCIFGDTNTQVSNKKVEFTKVNADQITSISVNHEKGSISIVIDEVYYLYYINSFFKPLQVIAISSVLNDLRSAKKITINHEKYGLHRKVTNLLMFY
ncbi:MAG: hypothetical protein GQ531_11745 [Sulfurovum sp.]|nr:hypothetical protein [Sulfurovum sp.]